MAIRLKIWRILDSEFFNIRIPWKKSAKSALKLENSDDSWKKSEVSRFGLPSLIKINFSGSEGFAAVSTLFTIKATAMPYLYYAVTHIMAEFHVWFHKVTPTLYIFPSIWIKKVALSPKRCSTNKKREINVPYPFLPPIITEELYDLVN